MPLRRPIFTPILVAMLLALGCIKRVPSNLPQLELSLHFGIDKVVRLGDTESQAVSRWKLSPRRVSLEGDPSFQSLNINQYLHFSDLGIRSYFRYGRVILIEVQEPFRGNIQGKRVQIFPFFAQSGKTWEDVLRREMGEPLYQASGGRLNSEALFYSWGDISFNKMGPNEIAVYRDAELRGYRKKNFGRVVQFFPE